MWKWTWYTLRFVSQKTISRKMCIYVYHREYLCVYVLRLNLSTMCVCILCIQSDLAYLYRLSVTDLPVCMYVCMYGWMYICMYVCMDGWMDAVCAYICTYSCIPHDIYTVTLVYLEICMKQLCREVWLRTCSIWDQIT